MAINVTCPGCLKRFTVADEHAGKKGPCPKCKKIIVIPKAEEGVVIHAPVSGPTDAQGREVLKTVKRSDGKFDPLVATGVSIAVLLTLLIGFLLRDTEASKDWLTQLGLALPLGPLLAWAGYGFLRDQELEPYQGAALWIRAAAAGVVFVIGWIVYYLIASQVGVSDWQTTGLEMWQAAFAAVVAVAIATFASMVSLDLEPFMAFLHCSLFYVATVLLRWIMALPLLPGIVGEGG